MSQLIARILLSIMVFPLAGIFYTVTFVVAEQSLRGTSYSSRDMTAFFAAGALTWIFVAAYWIGLWHKSIQWGGGRQARTFGAALGAAIAGTLAGAMTSGIDSGFGMFVGTVTAPLLWLVATVFIWRETAAERAKRLDSTGKDAVVCPTCGYNLTGLKESRCPECGTQFTLDQLLAAQPSRVQGEIEG